MILWWTILTLLLIELDILVVIFDGALLPFIFIGLLGLVIEYALIYSIFIYPFFVFDPLPLSRVYEELKICYSGLENISDAYGTRIYVTHQVVGLFCIKNRLIEHSPIFGSRVSCVIGIYVDFLSHVTLLLFFVQNHHKITCFQSCDFVYKILLFLDNIILFTKFIKQVWILEQQVVPFNVQYFEVTHKILSILHVCAFGTLVSKLIASATEMDSLLSNNVKLLVDYVVDWFCIFYTILRKIIRSKIVIDNVICEHSLAPHNLELVTTIFVGEIE